MTMIDKHLKKPKRDLGGFVTSQKIQQTKSDSDLLNWVCGQGAVNIQLKTILSPVPSGVHFSLATSHIV